MKKIYRYILSLSAIVVLISCGGEKNNLTNSVESAWDDMDNGIEKSAEEACTEFADNPHLLIDNDCSAEYSTFFDDFTLTIPFDNKTYAAIGLIFGSDAANFLSTIDNFNRGTRSKEDVKKLILKNFNSKWASLMAALIVLDGKFTYEFETENWIDNSFDFDSKALYKVLNDKDYFNGGYGENIPGL